MKTSKTIGRITLVLEGRHIGDDLMITLTGGAAHIGAVALAYIDPETNRAVASVLAAPGHKEAEIALSGAETICNALRRTVLFAAGIHLDHILPEEIEAIVKACPEIIENSLKNLD